jgi:arginine decarboxylase
MKTKYIELVEQTFEWPQEEFQLDKDNLLFHGIPLMEIWVTPEVYLPT